MKERKRGLLWNTVYIDLPVRACHLPTWSQSLHCRRPVSSLRRKKNTGTVLHITMSNVEVK